MGSLSNDQRARKISAIPLGIKFTVYTDCRAFTQTSENNRLSPRIHRWGMDLEEYDMEVKHQNGERMQHVDALSRVAYVRVIEDSMGDQIQRAQSQDPELKAVLKIFAGENILR